MKHFTLLRSLVFISFLAAFIAACTSQKLDSLPVPTAALSVATARAWYETAYKATKTINANSAQANAPVINTAWALNWSRAITLRGSQPLVLVPLQGDAQRFASQSMKGSRYLVVAQESNTKAPIGLLIELLLQQSTTPIDTTALVTSLYQHYLTGTPTTPIEATGLAIFYSADYHYRTGQKFVNGIFQPGTVRLAFRVRNPTSTTAMRSSASTSPDSPDGSITNYTAPICMDSYQIMDDGSRIYIGSYGDCSNLPPPPGDGSGGPYGGTGDGGWGGDSGGGGGDTGGGIGTGTGTGTTSLSSQLVTNSLALLKPCPGLTDAWRPLIGYTPPSSVIARLNNLTAEEKGQVLLFSPTEPVNIQGDTWQIQAIQNASGIAINLDYFSVIVTQLPSQYSTPEALLNGMRLNFNNYINTYLSSFSPNPLLPGESDRWASQNPLGTIMSISIPGNSGSVITSAYDDHHWVFSTIHDPLNNNHPVSGNREFGFTPLGNGSYNFYIRGVDRIDNKYVESLGSLTNPPLPFLAADALWQSWQNGFASSITSNGGKATTQQPTMNRPNWTAVLTALRTHRPLSTVPCN